MSFQFRPLNTLFILLTFVGGSTSFSAPSSDPLSDVVALGVQNAFSVNSQKLKLEKAHNSQYINYTSLLPTLSLSAGRTYQRAQSLDSSGDITTNSDPSSSLKVDAKWTLWDNYRSIRNIQKGDLALQAEVITSKKEVQQYVLNLISSYLDYQLLLNRKEILLVRLEQSRWTNDESQALVRVGAKTKLDAMDSEIEVANTERDLLELENNLLVAEKNLQVLINSKELKSLPRLDLLTHQPYYLSSSVSELEIIRQQWKKKVDTSNPDLQIRKLQLDQSLMELSQSKLSYFPQTSIILSHQWDFDSYVAAEPAGGRRTGLQSSSIALALTWQFWDWWATPLNVQNAAKDHQVLINDYRESNFKAQAEIENILRNLDVLEKTIRATRMVVEKAEAQARYSREVFRLGRITLLSMQQAISRLYDAKISLAERLKENHILIAKLYYATGRDLTPPGLDLSWIQ